MTEQRRLAFQLPPDVFAQLCEETLAGQSDDSFWEHLRSYYTLSPVQGDTVICDRSFVQYVLEEFVDVPPRWVFTQPLRPMQCMIIAGPGRAYAFIETLREIERLRDQAENDPLDPTP